MKKQPSMPRPDTKRQIELAAALSRALGVDLAKIIVAMGDLKIIIADDPECM
jgi:hypothetical protein